MCPLEKRGFCVSMACDCNANKEPPKKLKAIPRVNKAIMQGQIFLVGLSRLTSMCPRIMFAGKKGELLLLINGC